MPNHIFRVRQNAGANYRNTGSFAPIAAILLRCFCIWSGETCAAKGSEVASDKSSWQDLAIDLAAGFRSPIFEPKLHFFVISVHTQNCDNSDP